MIPAFESWENIHKSSDIEVLRCIIASDKTPIIVKRAQKDATGSAILHRLRHEHTILCLLQKAGVRGVPRPVFFSEAERLLATSDASAVALDRIVAEGRLPLAQTIEVITQIAEIVGEVHLARILHCDITLSNVTLNRSTMRCEVIDFGLAVTATSDLRATGMRSGIEGTLPYLSAERTGRVNRSVDRRSDYYSLGICFYHLLTGQLPFASTSDADLLHAILTQEPKSVTALSPTLPPTVGAIVRKLMARNAEDRYQSVRGLLHDLKRCLFELNATGSVSSFDIGTEDRDERFVIPDKLYGRSSELTFLSSEFRRIKQGCSAVVFVRGASGLGKSELVRKMRPDVVTNGGLLVSGKVDQLRRHVPFSSISHAVSELARYMLRSTPSELDGWRKTIQQAVGSVGQALVDAVPALTPLMGELRPLPELAPQENEERRLAVFLRFLRAISVRIPLVVFLDDLQWADSATIKVVRSLADAQSGIKGLLLIGAYREADASMNTAFTHLRTYLREAGARIEEIEVKPLTVDDITQMVIDTTRTAKDVARPFAAELFSKTAGNVYFVRQLLNHLSGEAGALTYDVANDHWSWSLEVIKGSDLTGNVVELLSATMRKLGAPDQEVLNLAAALGAEFSATDLATVSGSDLPKVDESLQRFAQHSFVMRISEGKDEPRYKFVHDRVQQTAYELLPQEHVLAVHRRIANAIIARREDMPLAKYVFDVVDHLLVGLPSVQDPSQQQRDVEYYYVAAEESMRANAYAIARRYFDACLCTLGSDPWTHNYERAWKCFVQGAECDFMMGANDVAERSLSQALEHSHSALERAEIQRRRALAMTALGRWDEAVDAGIAGLVLLGYKVSRRPSMAAVLKRFASVAWLLRGKDLEKLAGVPDITDARELKKMEVLSSFVFAAFMSNGNLFALTTLSMTHTTVQHGNSRYAAYAYAAYCVPLANMNRYLVARPMAKLSLDLLSRRSDNFVPAFAMLVAHNFVEYVALQPRQLAHIFRDAFRVGMETGDPIYGGLSGTQEIVSMQRVSLAEAEEAAERYSGHVLSRHDPLQLFSFRIRQLTTWCFLGKTRSPLSWDTEDFSEARDAVRFPAAVVREIYFGHRAWTLFVHGDLSAAYAALIQCIESKAASPVDEWSGHIYYLVGSLILVEHAVCNGRRRVSHRAWLNRSLKKFRAEAAGNATLGYATLVEAELAGLAGRRQQALEYFDRAICELERGQHICTRALAYERAARYCLRVGMESVARGYCAKAIDAYGRWGASVKVSMLKQEWSAHLTLAASLDSQHSSRHALVTTQIDSGVIDVQDIVAASNALMNERSAERILELVLKLARKNAGADRAVIVVNRSGQWVATTDMSRQGPDTNAMSATMLPERIIDFVRASSETVMINDTAQPHGYEEDPYLTQHRPKSLMCASLTNQGESLGVLYLENRTLADAFTPARLQLVSLIATQAAVSLDKAYIHAHLEEVVAERTQQLTQATEKVVRLEKQALEVQLAGGFAHEIRNALSGASFGLRDVMAQENNALEIGGGALEEIFALTDGLLEGAMNQTLREKIGDTAHSLLRIEEALELIESGMERGQTICNEILAYAQLGHVQTQYQRLSVANIIERLQHDLEPVFKSEGLSLDVALPDELAVQMQEDHFYAILRNLLANARDAVRQKGITQEARVLIVRGSIVDRMVRIDIADNGVGIAPELRSRLFAPFFSTKGAHGTGLGLSTSRKLLEVYGGTLTLEDDARYSTLFSVRLPHRG